MTVFLLDCFSTTVDDLLSFILVIIHFFNIFVIQCRLVDQPGVGYFLV